MLPKETYDLLVATFGEIVSDFTEGSGIKDPFCRVKPERLLEVMRTLRDHPALQFDFLESITAVDWPKSSEIQLVYHLFSYPLRHDFVLKVTLGREAPNVASLAALWDSADWLEREQYDLMGVVFAGHPDLRRLLLPEDWDGHPLRKDYRQPAEYRGMRTTRPSPLDLLPAFDAHNRAQQATTKGDEK
ncbi:MAG: NADH-quinone oxidoreductase subunit C [Deltaproteobacteria bacterium]|nr:NADH-quinone oxidoreductase subunit C [Deltaproteobacteria bacterium]